MTDTTRKLFRENLETGGFDPMPLVETELHPTAVEVVDALRQFVAEATHDDLVIMRVQQAQVLVERTDEIAAELRKYADRIVGPPKTGPEASQDAAGDANSPRTAHRPVRGAARPSDRRFQAARENEPCVSAEVACRLNSPNTAVIMTTTSPVCSVVIARP